MGWDSDGPGATAGQTADLHDEITRLRKALEITQKMIKGEIIENAVIDTQTMQSLGSMIKAALAQEQPDAPS
jgi:hypothetical protein